MDISFGIVVGPGHDPKIVNEQIHNIQSQYWEEGYDNYEILLIGSDLGEYGDYYDLKIIPFDENHRPGWITKKKNILVRNVRFPITCIMHDYLLLDINWLEGVKKANKEITNWDILCNKVYTMEGHRSADWLISPEYMQLAINQNPPKYIPMLMEVAPHENHPKYVNGLPYTVTDLSELQYVSGGFILARTDVFKYNPFDENMIWGDAPGEDVVWSKDVIRRGYSIKWNKYSMVRIGKPNKWHVYQMPDEFVEVLRFYNGLQ